MPAPDPNPYSASMGTLHAADTAFRDLVDVALADPVGFRRDAAELFSDAAGDDARTVAVRWALGAALRELGDLPGARRELDAAAQGAQRLGALGTAALVRSSLALVLLHLGETEAALATTALAAEHLTGPDAARNEMQRGLLLQRLGRLDEAVDAYGRALPILREADDVAAEARLLGNRGVVHAYLGDLTAAAGDLRRSLALARELGTTPGIAIALQNLAFVAARRGEIPPALALLEQAQDLLDDEQFATSAMRACIALDRADVLADAGLLEEALEVAADAAEVLAAGDDRTNAAEAELQLARTLLLAHHHTAAADHARRAGGAFRAARRDGWELQARYVTLAAASAAEGHVEVSTAAALADDLQAGGWHLEARSARLLVAEQALRAGDPALAGRVLDDVLTDDVDGDLPALARAQHCYATALVQAASGRRADAELAVARGVDVLHRSRLTFGSAELRAHAARHTVDLVRLGVRLALEDGRPDRALCALDRVRAADVAVAPRPPGDPVLADLLAELRRLERAERDAARGGGDPRPYREARARAERRVRDRARTTSHAVDRHAVASVAQPADATLDVDRLRQTLDGRVLVAYAELDARLHQLTVHPSGVRHRVLGPAAEVRDAVALMRSAVRRLARGRASAASMAAADASVARSARDLAGRLGLDRLDAPLVIVPCGALDGLPWSTLTIGRSVPTVVPSAAAWLAATDGCARPGTPDLLVAGPELPGADAEVAALAVEHPATTALTGPHATVAAVGAALADATTAHVAAHGVYRTDNPLFSCLRLADGALNVYDLEKLSAVPRTLVLSSCDAATTATVAGDAVLGLGSALLRLGVGTLIAPVLEIPDTAAVALMVDLHRRLANGTTAASALAASIEAADDAEPAHRAVRHAFVVLGDGGGV